LQETQDALLLKATEDRQRLEDKVSDLSHQGKRHCNGLLEHIIQARQATETELSDQKRQQDSQSGNILRKIGNQTSAINGLDRRLEKTHKEAISYTKELVEICCGMKTSNERSFQVASLRSHHIQTQVASLKREQEDVRTEISFGFHAIFLQLQMLCTIGQNLLSNLVPFSEIILEYLRKNITSNMEIYALLLKIQANIPNRLLIQHQDSIFFVDVLGRNKALPYEYFRHWDVFESMLRCDFKGLPGERRVAQGDYILTNSQMQGLQIRKDDWERTVFPETSVNMSVIMRTLILRETCPRHLCPGEVTMTPSDSMTLCSTCGITVMSRLLPDSGRTKDPRDTTSPTAPPVSKLNVVMERLRNLYQMEDLERDEITVFRMVHVLGMVLPKTNMLTDYVAYIERVKASISKSGFLWWPMLTSCRRTL